jgi:hypothetical protein
MPVLVRLARAAERSLTRLGATAARRLVLSLFMKAVLGVQRIFHFETLDDPGVAILTGGRRVVGRKVLGALVRAAPLRGVLRLVRATTPRLARARTHVLSLDEHAIARFTRKFRIPKGFHSIRNKLRKVEKIVFACATSTSSLLALVVTHGRVSRTAAAQRLLPQVRRRARGAVLRVLLDSGASLDHAALWAVANHPRQVTLVRVRRAPGRRRAWAALPARAWQRREELGPSTYAPPKVVHVAETRTALTVDRTCRPPRVVDVRTVVVREAQSHGKERGHALWVFGDETTPAWDVVQEFRQRQHHEQLYRVLVHDLFVDAAPSGYVKQSPNPERPGFRQNALTLYAWLAALAAGALASLSRALPLGARERHPRTLRRWLLQVPADLFLGRNTLLVVLYPRHLRALWHQLVGNANRRPVRIPWMDNRTLILSLDLPAQPKHPEAAFSPNKRGPDVW